MTIPMMPGWWDQNKEALESLAQTTTRIMNPNFDAQVALMNSIRQDPANMQAAVNASAMNPQMFTQMFGERMAQRLNQTGTPDFATQTEIRARESANVDPSTLAPTVLNEAMGRKTGVEVGTQRRQSEATLAATTQNIARTADIIWREGLNDRALEARAAEVDRAIAENPQIGLVNPRGLAQELFDAKDPNEPTLNRRIEALATTNEAAYEIFKESYRVLNQADYQRQAYVYNEAGRNDTMEAQLRAAARSLARELNGEVSVEDAYRYLALDPNKPPSLVAQRALQDNQLAKERTQRLAQVSTVLTRFADLAKMKNKNTPDAERLRDMVGGQLTAILDIPLSIETTGNVLMGRDTRFVTADGRVIDGTLLGQMISDPVVANVFKATDEQIAQAIANQAAQQEAAKAQGPAAVELWTKTNAILLAEQQRRAEEKKKTRPTTGRRQ